MGLNLRKALWGCSFLEYTKCLKNFFFIGINLLVKYHNNSKAKSDMPILHPAGGGLPDSMHNVYVMPPAEEVMLLPEDLLLPLSNKA